MASAIVARTTASLVARLLPAVLLMSPFRVVQPRSKVLRVECAYHVMSATGCALGFFVTSWGCLCGLQARFVLVIVTPNRHHTPAAVRKGCLDERAGLNLIERLMSILPEEDRLDKIRAPLNEQYRLACMDAGNAHGAPVPNAFGLFYPIEGE